MTLIFTASDSNTDRLHKNTIVRTDEVVQEEEEEDGIATDNETEDRRTKRNNLERHTSEVEDEVDADATN